ncbi:histone deacetylation protein Rxt3-domain-containing protein [Obelidium mucronatum]|nr:histone deacetylation protein Rxt3-domain-containing protein [Obelidium mucronatum]
MEAVDPSDATAITKRERSADAAPDSDAKRRKPNAGATVGAAAAAAKPQIGKVGEVTVVNADALLAADPSKVLGCVTYAPPTRTAAPQNDPRSLALSLLPEFNTDHLFGSLDIRIPAEHLSYTRNPAVQCRAVWGTDIYTDDSDIVAAIIHSGHYRPVDGPAFKHHVITKQSIVDQHTTNMPSSPQGHPTSTPTTPPAPTNQEGPPPSAPTQPIEAKTVQTDSIPTLIATPHPIYTDQPLHDLLVTIRVLPRLVKYTGTTCTAVQPVLENENVANSSAETKLEPASSTDPFSSGAASSSVVFASRGWGGSHQGESIRIERVVEIPSKQSIPGFLRTSTGSATQTHTIQPTILNNRRYSQKASSLSGRKSGAVEWCAVGVQERVLGGDVYGSSLTGGVGGGVAGGAGTVAAIEGRRRSVIGPGVLASVGRSLLPNVGGSIPVSARVGGSKRKDLYEAVRVLFSSVDGRACFKYSPQVLIEWPKYLQDSLVDLNTKPVAAAVLPTANVSLGLTGQELKKMEGWAYWRVRLSIPKTILELEDEIGTRLVVFVLFRHHSFC